MSWKSSVDHVANKACRINMYGLSYTVNTVTLLFVERLLLLTVHTEKLFVSFPGHRTTHLSSIVSVPGCGFT